MSINVIDNFSINVLKPIDSRMVVADASARNAIIYKYDGMSVFQLNNRFTYTWNSSTVGWEVLNEDVMDGYFPVGNNLKLVSSSMYSALGSGKVGINVTSEDPKGILQLNSIDTFPANPLVFHVGDTSGAVIGYNWYYDGSENKFDDIGFGCSAIRFDNDGLVYFNAYKDGDAPTVFSGSPMMALNPWSSSIEFISTIYVNDTSALSFGNFSSETKIYSPVFDILSFNINGSDVININNNKIGISGISNASYSIHTSGSIGLSGSIFFDKNSNGLIMVATASTIGKSLTIKAGAAGAPAYVGGNLNLYGGGNSGSINMYGGIASIGQGGGINIHAGVGGLGDPYGDISLSTNNEIIRLSGTGDLFANVHGASGSGTASYLNPSISSGEYTPAFSNGSNCTLSSITPAGWSRVGNVVTVSGRITIDPVSSATNTSFSLSLPISTTFYISASFVDDRYKLNGVGKCKLSGSSGDVCIIEGTGTGVGVGLASFFFYATQLAPIALYYVYQYTLGYPAPTGR